MDFKPNNIYLTSLFIILLFNVVYMAMTPNFNIFNLSIGLFTGLLISALASGVISGIKLFGSGLDGVSVKIVFGIATLINILFSIPIGNDPQAIPIINSIANSALGVFSPLAYTSNGFQIGLGLGTSILNIFVGTDPFIFLGYLFVWLLIFANLISGLVIIIGSGN